MRKKLIVLGAVALITACSVSLAACGSSATSASLYSTWFNRIDYGGIQPNVKSGQIEEAEYDIGFEEGNNDGYEISMATEEEDGEPYKMTTKFYTLTYDWGNPLAVIEGDEYNDLSGVELPEFPADYGPEDEYDNTEVIYGYSMYYTIPVTYSSDDFEERTYFNTHYSVCYFRTVNSSMMPVFSYEYSLSVTPSNPSVLSRSLLVAFSYQNTAYYNYDCTECTCTCKDIEPEDLDIYTIESDTLDDMNIYKQTEDKVTVVDLTESKNEFFDNASIYVVMRALNYYSASSFSADVFIPVERGFSTYTISGGVESVLNPDNDDQKKMLTAMEKAGYFDSDTASSEDEAEVESDEDGEDGTTLPKNIYYSDVTLTLNENLTGPSQEVWFAAAEGEKAFENENYTRATMLYMSIPFAYTLGTATFTLSKICSTFDEYREI